MFAVGARQALAENNRLRYQILILKAIEYQQRANQLPPSDCLCCCMDMTLEGYIHDDIPLCHVCYESAYAI